jgi:hypothetical protein
MADKLIALLICDATSTSPDGKITIYGIFDAISCKHLPLIHPQFSIFWRFITEKGSEVSLIIKNPDGSHLITTDLLKLGDAHKCQGVYSFGNVEFPVEGEYNVALLVDGKEFGSVELTVKKI